MSRVPRRHKSIVSTVLVWAGSLGAAAIVWFTLVWLALRFWAH